MRLYAVLGRVTYPDGTTELTYFQWLYESLEEANRAARNIRKDSSNDVETVVVRIPIPRKGWIKNA